VRRIVLGPAALSLVATPAMLAGYRCAPVERGRFPAIVAEEGSVTQGVLVREAPLEAAVRTSYFEGDGADYDIVRKSVAVGDGMRAGAWVCVAASGLQVEAGEWCFETWQRQWRPAFLRNARAAMAGAVPAELGRYRRIWLGRLSRAPGFRSPGSSGCAVSGSSTPRGPRRKRGR